MTHSIAQFLEKFKVWKPPEASVRKAFEAAAADCGLSCEGIDIRVMRGVVYVAASPIIKSELALRKAQIIERLKVRLPGAYISDLR